jgi:hypothetical protein
LSIQPKYSLEFSRWVILDTGGFMNIQNIVVEIDAEISRLQQVMALLTGTSTTKKQKPGQPANASLAAKARTRRTLSAEGREKIAAAQRARWAKSKKAAKKAPAVGIRAKSKKKRTLSAGARAKIAAAQRVRWAKVWKAKEKASAAKAAKKSAPAPVAPITPVKAAS